MKLVTYIKDDGSLKTTFDIYKDDLAALGWSIKDEQEPKEEPKKEPKKKDV